MWHGENTPPKIKTSMLHIVFPQLTKSIKPSPQHISTYINITSSESRYFSTSTQKNIHQHHPRSTPSSNPRSRTPLRARLGVGLHPALSTDRGRQPLLLRLRHGRLSRLARGGAVVAASNAMAMGRWWESNGAPVRQVGLQFGTVKLWETLRTYGFWMLQR